MLLVQVLTAESLESLRWPEGSVGYCVCFLEEDGAGAFSWMDTGVLSSLHLKFLRAVVS